MLEIQVPRNKKCTIFNSLRTVGKFTDLNSVTFLRFCCCTYGCCPEMETNVSPQYSSVTISLKQSPSVLI